MRHPLTPVSVAITEKARDNECEQEWSKKWKHLHIVGRSVDWSSHSGRKYGDSPRN